MKHFSLILIAAVGLLVGCKNSQGTTKVSATGSIYECLVVCPKAVYEPILSVMGADMPCLPQMEPYFTVTHVSNAAFDDLFKPTRNILMVDIDSTRYTALKAKFSRDYWSTPQRVYRIQSPDIETFLTYWQSHGEQIRDWFVREELMRQRRFVDKDEYIAIMDTTLGDTSIEWRCNNKGTLRRDLVTYTYPYTDADIFTLDHLCAKRDSILGAIITAQVPGSHMGTEYKIFPPQLRMLSDDQGAFFAAEVRGLWKMYDGEAMGGPFVSLTRLSEDHTQVITSEVFIFAPGQKKRNALRTAEAILYGIRTADADGIRTAALMEDGPLR